MWTKTVLISNFIIKENKGMYEDVEQQIRDSMSNIQKSMGLLIQVTCSAYLYK